MTTTADEAALLAAVSADPADALASLAYADWLEEGGRPLRADAWRWKVAKGRAPRFRVEVGRGGGPWEWHVVTARLNDPCRSGVLPERLIEAINAISARVNFDPASPYTPDFDDSPAEALAALAGAFAGLPEDARRELWEWEAPW